MSTHRTLLGKHAFDQTLSALLRRLPSRVVQELARVLDHHRVIFRLTNHDVDALQDLEFLVLPALRAFDWATCSAEVLSKTGVPTHSSAALPSPSSAKTSTPLKIQT